MKKYAASHEWVETEGKKAKIGITSYAAGQLGDIVFIELPDIGTAVSAGKPFANIESVKAVSELFSPVTGKVTAINAAVSDAPELVNQDAENTWLIEVEAQALQDDLMTKQEYDAANI